MANSIAAFLAGLGTGYVNGTRYNDEQARLKKLDQMAQETHDAQMQASTDAATERKQKMANEKALRDAAAPVDVKQAAEVTGISTGPTQYSDPDLAAADARQSQTMAEASGNSAPAVTVTPKFAAGGINFDSQPQAAAAAAAANTPAARQARMQTALEQTGDYAGAASLKAANLQGQAAQQALSDSIWKHDLGAAMQAGHGGLAQLVSKSESGPMAGKTLKAVPSPDGKSVTYNSVGADGTMTPTNLTFSNDPAGVTQAAYMLDRTVSPEHRMDYAVRSGKNAAEIQELNAKAKYWDANAAKQYALASNGGTAPKRADHFDEKQWDTAAKLDKDTISLPDPMGGDKPVQSGDLRSQRMQMFNAFRAGGELSPQEAAEQADTAIVKIKTEAAVRVAQARKADKNSALTMDQAVKQLIQEGMKKAQASSAAPATNTSATKIPADLQAARDKDRVGILQSELAQAQARLGKGDPRAQGDVDALQRELRAAGAGRTPVAAAVGVPAATSKAAPAVAPAKIAASVGVPAAVPDDAASYESWVSNKLMGAMDGPNKLLEIARTNPNPKMKAAAQRLYERYQAQRDAQPAAEGAPL